MNTVTRSPTANSRRSPVHDARVVLAGAVVEAAAAPAAGGCAGAACAASDAPRNGSGAINTNDARANMLGAETAIDLAAARGAMARAASLGDDHYAAHPADDGSDDEIVAVFSEGQAAKAFVAEREENGDFTNVVQLAQRAPLDRPGLEALVASGACDVFGWPRRQLLWRLGLAPRSVSVGTGGDERQLTLPLGTTSEIGRASCRERVL